MYIMHCTLAVEVCTSLALEDITRNGHICWVVFLFLSWQGPLLLSPSNIIVLYYSHLIILLCYITMLYYFILSVYYITLYYFTLH